MNAPVDSPSAGRLDQGFQLGAIKIDPRSGEASGPGGCHKLDPKVMDVLMVLVQRAGQVVPREELLGKVWPNVVVTDEVLSRCIHDLRRQLGLAGANDDLRALIETLPKRGYRLHAEVTPIRPASHGGHSGPRWKRRAALGARRCAGAVGGVAICRPGGSAEPKLTIDRRAAF